MTAAILVTASCTVWAVVAWHEHQAEARERIAPRRRTTCPTCRDWHELGHCDGHKPMPGRWWA